MKNKIPIHSNELQAIGIRLLSLSELEKAPKVPHRDDHYVLLLQKKGLSIIEIDFREWKLEKAALCFVAPGQVHQYVKSKHTEGWLIFIETAMMHPDVITILDAFMHHHQIVDIDKAHYVFTACDLLHLFLSENNPSLRPAILASLSASLTSIFTAAFMFHTRQKPGIGSQKYQIINSFKSLIKQQFRENKQVKDYAAQLNITPLYLNEVSKGVTGFAASYWIHNAILLEARRLLFYTDMDIKQIAFALGYEDYAYFSRFFKKNTGNTPSSFRDTNHDLSNHHH